jgi:hypothetical protein
MASGFERPDSVIKRGTVGERAQLHGSLGSTAQYAERVKARRQEGGRAIEGVTFLPYGEAMAVIREVDDELTAKYDWMLRRTQPN